MWQDILKTAIVGTERNAFALPNDALGKLLAMLDANAREATLLSAAATVALYERAGQLPAVEQQSLPAPAELEDMPYCNAQAAQHLALMLSGEFAEALLEWFAALIVAKRRVPEEHLSALLQWGKPRTSLHEAISASIGQRGLWLARQNPAWDYIAGEINEAEWHTGAHVARLVLLKRVRAAKPAEARRLITATWNEDSPKQRAEFLATLYTNLSAADEDFLETVLDDRSTLVRRVAADLLSELPDSAFVQRMIAHAQPLFSFAKKARGKYEIEITLPTERTEAMIRDGITAKKLNIGEKTWWLQQMVRAIPVNVWEQTSGWQVADLLSACKKSEWKDVLLGAWLESAWRQNRVDWMQAIFSASSLKHKLPTQLTDHWNKQNFEALITDLLRETPDLRGDKPASWLLNLYEQQWSVALSTQVIQVFSQQLSGKFLIQEWYFLARIMLYLNPTTIPNAIAVLSIFASEDGERQKLIQRLLDVLNFRQDILKEITQ